MYDHGQTTAVYVSMLLMFHQKIIAYTIY